MRESAYARRSFEATYEACYDMYIREPERRGCGLARILYCGKLTYGLLNRVKTQLRVYESMQDEDDIREWTVCAMVSATIENTYKAIRAARHGADTPE